MYLCQITQESMLLYYSKYTYVEPLSNGLACLDLYKTLFLTLIPNLFIFFSYPIPTFTTIIIQKYVTHAVKDYING